MLRKASLESSVADSESMQSCVASMASTEPCDRALCQMKDGASFIEKVDAVIVNAPSVINWKMPPSASSKDSVSVGHCQSDSAMLLRSPSTCDARRTPVLSVKLISSHLMRVTCKTDGSPATTNIAALSPGFELVTLVEIQ